MILSALVCSGCASVLTVAAPRESEIVDGKTVIGKQVHVEYSVLKSSGGYYLMKKPYCQELVEKNRVSRKRLRGLLLAEPEVIIWGLGIADWAVADAISESSAEVERVDLVETGILVLCGESVLARNETVIIQFPETLRTVSIRADSNGRLNLENATSDPAGEKYMNLFIQSGQSLAYITSMSIR